MRMKFLSVIITVACLVLAGAVQAKEELKVTQKAAASDVSLQFEIKNSIDRGLRWLAKSQNPGGFWSQPEHPALTGLVLTAFMGEPFGAIKSSPPDGIVKGYEYLLQCAKPDGGIYVKDLANYNTSVAVMALVSAYNPSYEPVIRKARNFLVGMQQDYDEKGKADNPFDGGIGYGTSYTHSDMSNTLFALEAIYYTKFLGDDKGPEAVALKQLDWAAAIKFIERSQNLPGSNDQPWASGDPANKGGFIYFPGDSKAGTMDLPDGKKAFRSYGSISYAGLLSYIYADLKADDPRVKAVLGWLQENYTLEENPGMGPEGLYYFYHMMAKGLAAAGVDILTLKDGSKVNWRRELALKLLNLQKEDGSWVNENGRWWEKDPVLVTAYASIIMEILHKGI